MLAIVRIALSRPYTFVVAALLILLIGVFSAMRMPVDIFPKIDIPIIGVAWQYTGMPPDDMSGRILTPFERTLTTTVNDIEHIEANSYTTFGIVKIYFHPTVNIATANAQVTAVSQTLLKQLPPGATPPLIVNYTASTVPIIQLALSGKGLTEQNLADLGTNFVRTRLVTVQGAGIHDFDMITSGLQNTDLIIVAARPSMGKTSLCLSIAEHVALKEKKPVAIFSLEMSKEQLAMRMLCSQAQVNAHKLRTGHLSEDEWGNLAQVVQDMYDAPIFIDDATETSALTMRAKCRRLMAEHGLGLIVVDYLQLMRSHRRTENRVQEIGEIARGLKSLGRELKVPVIARSQLSRAVESRENKRPMLSDLRESGSIEAEADMVCFLYREAYYKMKEAYAVDGADRPEREPVEETEIIVGKHRNGPTGMVKVGFMSEYAKFVDLELRRDDEPTGF